MDLAEGDKTLDHPKALHGPVRRRSDRHPNRPTPGPTDTDPTDSDPTRGDYSSSTTTADNVIGAPMVAALMMGWAQIRIRHVVMVLGAASGNGPAGLT